MDLNFRCSLIYLLGYKVSEILNRFLSVVFYKNHTIPKIIVKIDPYKFGTIKYEFADKRKLLILKSITIEDNTRIDSTKRTARLYEGKIYTLIISYNH